MIDILVVEDEVSTRSNIEQLLTRSGYSVRTADCGEAAFELARIKKPDLILSDIMMQGMDGYELLRKISDDPALQFVPLIFLTAMTDNSDLRKGMLAGADDYITKPFKAKDLLASIEIRLKKREKSDNRINELTSQPANNCCQNPISEEDPDIVNESSFFDYSDPVFWFEQRDTQIR